MVWLSNKSKVDYAEQSKDVIVHFSKDSKPVLMEILNASKFVQEAASKLPAKIKKQTFVHFAQ